MSFELQEQDRRLVRLRRSLPMDEHADLPVERFMRDYYRHARA